MGDVSSFPRESCGDATSASYQGCCKINAVIFNFSLFIKVKKKNHSFLLTKIGTVESSIKAKWPGVNFPLTEEYLYVISI